MGVEHIATAEGGLPWRELLARPLPFQAHSALNRMLARLLCALAQGRVRILDGLEHVVPGCDPFVLALNHTSRGEALLVPPLLAFHRGGKLIHFLADWNFRLIPGVGLLYRRGGVITVTHKRARPRLLEVCKPLFREALPPLGQARLHLLAGDSLGIFPEGTVNRDGERLLRGRHGAARLSLAAGVPVVPAGIRRGPSRTLELRIGAPQQPPGDGMGLAEVREWHAHIMAGIARLSGKRWSYRSDCHAP